MRKEKSRDAARSRRSKENHEFYELAKLLPLPAAITSQLDFLDKASIIRLTISFLKLRQFSVNGHPPWAPDFTTLGSVNPYTSQSSYAEHYSNSSQDDPQSRPTSVVGKQAPTATALATTTLSNNRYGSSLTDHAVMSLSLSSVSDQSCLNQSMPPSSVAFPQIETYQQQQASRPRDGTPIISEKSLSKNTASLFDVHQGTHILQSLDGFAFAIGRDGRFLYISETVSMYLGLSQVEMTGSSVFDYTHQQDHEELAKQLGIPYTNSDCNQDLSLINTYESPPPASVHSQYSAASNETLIEDYVNANCPRKRIKAQPSSSARGAYGRNKKRVVQSKQAIKIEASTSDVIDNESRDGAELEQKEADMRPPPSSQGTNEDPLVRQFCIRMKSTLTKRGCQHFKSSGYRVVHVVAHLRSYQSNDHGHLMDPLDEAGSPSGGALKQSRTRRAPKAANKEAVSSVKESQQAGKGSSDNSSSDTSSGDCPAKEKIIGMVAVAIALPPPSINELRLDTDTFVLRLSLDLRVTHIEPKITELLHYPVELIAGRSLYSLIHPADVYQVQKCHRDLLRKGQMMSGYYRLLSRNGGYIWVQTCATLICNNTLGAQASVMPNSPMPTPNSSLPAHLNHGDHVHKLPYYLAPATLTSSDLNANQYSGGCNQSKIVSPGLSSHLSSTNDNQDQDQCVIFVNYMITNVIGGNEIMDICQGTNYTPLSSFSGNGNAVFSSPSSSCSSPCHGSLKAGNTSCGSYISPPTPSSGSINLSSPRRQHGESKSREIKLANGRRAASSSSASSSAATKSAANVTGSKADAQIYLVGSVTSDENNHDGHLTHSQSNFHLPDQVKLDAGNHFDTVASSTADPTSAIPIYSYSQTPGSMNLALNKAHSNDAPSWLSHPQGGRLSEASVVYGSNQAGADHYSTMNRSIYKAAFGLDVSGASYNHHHHQPTSVYPANPNTYQPSAASGNSWDTAAVAAVAAASNLTNHHHHSSTNPYAHLDHSHQSTQSLSSATNHHHTPAGTYYNYYGYYGNKFI